MDECTKCGWIGPDEDKGQTIDQEMSKEAGVEAKVSTCPNCGNDEFYAD